jgi:hypothetical protein
MLGRVTNQEPTPYATSADFCRIFQNDMQRLYLLSFLLTADHSMAEKCFVCGLDDSGKGNPIFKEWAQSWARRTIIQNAIQMMRPRPADSTKPSSTSGRSAGHAVTEPTQITEIVELPTFERFAFVMSVLERYSDQECSLLLDSTRAEVTAARTRALRQIGRSAELSRGLISVGTEEQPVRDGLVPLAASA